MKATPPTPATTASAKTTRATRLNIGISRRHSTTDSQVQSANPL
jgi:hypothetical protein